MHGPGGPAALDKTMPSTNSTSGPLSGNGRGVQQQSLRRANERAVMTAIGLNPGLSNADIARFSGLAPQTVSAILLDLEAAGLLRRGAVLRGRRGQPATPIFTRADGAFAIGAEIGWKHLDVLLTDLHGQVLARRHRRHAFPDAGRVADDIAAAIRAMLPNLAEALRPRLCDIGVALPSHIGRNLHLTMPEAPPGQADLWLELDLVEELKDRTGLEVSLFNDGSAAAWGELVGGPPPRPASFSYFLISCYIATGLAGADMLHEGPPANASSLGAMLVGIGADGTLRPAHDIASLTALERRLRAGGIAPDARPPADWDWQGFGPLLDSWIADSAAALARVAYNTSTVFESGLVVVDGILPRPIIERLVAAMETELARLPETGQSLPRLQAGHRGAEAPAIGAAELALYRRHFLREAGAGSAR